MLYKLNNNYPTIHDTGYIAPGAKLIGDVDIGEQSSVWFNAVLRGDNAKITVQQGSNIQDGTIIHVDEGYPCYIGKNVTVGHNVILHGCTIEDGALIGMGSTVLNGAVIKKGALVAAGSVITENTVVKEGMLAAGVPAKVLKEVTDKQREFMLDGVNDYIQKSEMYRKEKVRD